ncbi:MAG: LytTR family DNA-binding domain-containing protein [Butyrivibrio sp.]|nr:LytTR family DNA-binding domain-containing protein [Acetatifactor muris]MCM1561517.1 LytTR family DNA-binding domain-containing protein [Butyrivibrio sp.]
MKIAVCDDEIVLVKQIYQYLWGQPDCSVDCFSSPGELLARYEAGERYDVLFLDVLMQPVNGIALARKIRSRDRNAVLIFLTAYLEYAPEGYEVNAFRYLLKPVQEQDIAAVMMEVRRELESTRTLQIRTSGCEMLLHTRELKYLEADNKDTLLYYMDDTITLRKGLNELEAQLSPFFFFRVHRKFLVNLTHVREFDETRLTLDCGKTLPISRRRSRAFRLALGAYIDGGLNR